MFGVFFFPTPTNSLTPALYPVFSSAQSGPVYLEFASDATKLKAQSHKTAPTSEANCKPRPPVSD